jgi:hypothetical protein
MLAARKLRSTLRVAGHCERRGGGDVLRRVAAYLHTRHIDDVCSCTPALTLDDLIAADGGRRNASGGSRGGGRGGCRREAAGHIPRVVACDRARMVRAVKHLPALRAARWQRVRTLRALPRAQLRVGLQRLVCVRDLAARACLHSSGILRRLSLARAARALMAAARAFACSIAARELLRADALARE